MRSRQGKDSNFSSMHRRGRPVPGVDGSIHVQSRHRHHGSANSTGRHGTGHAGKASARGPLTSRRRAKTVAQGRLALTSRGPATPMFRHGAASRRSARRQGTAGRTCAADNRRRGGLREAVRRSGAVLRISGPGGAGFARTAAAIYRCKCAPYDDPLMHAAASIFSRTRTTKGKF